ncbi:hypothetical protein [Dyella sp. C11]|uniref:hypothetical protein n=1 Tax=Dyella sp. C11 TaxID=2126991 RepID=UPI000D6474E2|nr:hypothetical protein [Dyella sp. C11]
MAWQFNAHADAMMIACANALGAPALSGLILRRFADNEPLKGAVRSLARSDAMHPFDTLERTAQTARAMWQCLGLCGAEQRRPSRLRIWGMTIMYSVCVLVWLADGTRSQKAVRSSVHLGVRLLGEH